MRKKFQIQFLTSQRAPTGKHALSLVCAFGLGHFPRSKIECESIFLIKYYIFTIIKKKKFEAFWFIFKKVKKMDFSLHFQILRKRV